MENSRLERLHPSETGGFPLPYLPWNVSRMESIREGNGIIAAAQTFSIYFCSPTPTKAPEKKTRKQRRRRRRTGDATPRAFRPLQILNLLVLPRWKIWVASPVVCPAHLLSPERGSTEEQETREMIQAQTIRHPCSIFLLGLVCESTYT